MVNLINLLAAFTNSGSFWRFFMSDHTSRLCFIQITIFYSIRKYLKFLFLPLLLLSPIAFAGMSKRHQAGTLILRGII